MCNFKYSVVLVLSVILFIACENPQKEAKTTIVEKTVVESVDSSAIVENDSFVVKIEHDLLGLTSKNNEDQHEIYSLHHQIKNLKTENDSLKTEVHNKDDIIRKIMNPKQEEISNNELEIRYLTQKLNVAWSKLIGAKDINELTSLFLPKYAVSMTSIAIDDKADVRMMLPDEFVEYANKIRKVKNASILIGNVNYLYFEGRDEVYSIVYSAVLRIYKDEVAVEDKSMVATLTVKKDNGQWKIGKYSWVTLGNEI